MRLSRSIAIVMPLIMLTMAAAIIAHKGKKHDDTQDRETANAVSSGEEPQSAIDETVQQRLDSLYADINAGYDAVKPILQQDCYNCHSNQTDYPWYYNLPGISTLIDDDIKEGLSHIDFSNGFPFGGHGTPLEDLRAIRDEIEEGEMPPLNYRFMHWGSAIEGKQRDTLFQWIDATTDRLLEFYEGEGIDLIADDNEHDSHQTEEE